MMGILSKMFLHNGRVPVIQIIVALVVGVLGSLAYIRYRKPAFILDFICSPAACPLPFVQGPANRTQVPRPPVQGSAKATEADALPETPVVKATFVAERAAPLSTSWQSKASPLHTIHEVVEEIEEIEDNEAECDEEAD